MNQILTSVLIGMMLAGAALATDRKKKVLIFAASIQGGVEPAPNDKLTTQTRQMLIVDVEPDPVKATFTCEVT